MLLDISDKQPLESRMRVFQWMTQSPVLDKFIAW